MMGAALTLTLLWVTPAAAQWNRVQCSAEQPLGADGAGRRFYHDATIIDGAIRSGYASGEGTVAGKVVPAAGAPFTRGFGRISESYLIDYPDGKAPRYLRRFSASFPLAEGTRIKTPIVISYLSGSTLLRRANPHASADEALRLSETIPDADFARMRGNITVTIDADGGRARLAEIRFAIPDFGSRAVYEAHYKPFDLRAVAQGRVPAGCTLTTR
jgi:hypothetical protein